MTICTEDQNTWQMITIMILQTLQLVIAAYTHGKVRNSNDETVTNNENDKSD